MAVKPDYADMFPKHQTVEDIFKALPENPEPRSEDADVHLYLAGRITLPELPGQAQEKQQEKANVANMGGSGSSEGQREGASSGEEHASGGENGEQKKGKGNAPAPGEQKAEAGSSASSGGEETQEMGEVDAAVDTSCDPMMREVWRQRILETAQNYEMMHGLLPGDIAEIVQQFRESKIDYMQKLRRYLTLHSGGNMQWLPPAKRFVWQKMYLPSRNNATLEAVLAIDTSGSTQNYIDKFFGDTLKIMRQFGKFHLTVIQCDAKITDVQEFTENSRVPKSLNAKGGGGTCFVPVFDYIDEKCIKPRVMLFFTDGYGSAPDKAPGYPVIWVLTPEGKKPCEWGDVIQIEE